MILFGCCVGPGGRFEAIAAGPLSRLMGEDDRLLRQTGEDGLCAAYNGVLREARELPECELVVLLHDDVELLGGADTRTRLLAYADRTPVLGVLGVVGGAGLFGPQWVDARRLAGTIEDYHGRRAVGPVSGAVEVVDGLLLVLGPEAFRTLDFDAELFPGFHGYDTDYCLQAVAAGLSVRVEPIAYRHLDRGHIADEAAFAASAQALLTKWPERIVPLRGSERLRRWVRSKGRTTAGRLRHRIGAALKGRSGRG